MKLVASRLYATVPRQVGYNITSSIERGAGVGHEADSHS